jgi:hypothetical protein
MARQRVDQRAAMFVIVNQKHRASATGFAVHLEQRAQSARQCIGWWHRIARGASRTDCGALAASGAHLRVDVDVVAVRRDRTCRTKIKAAPAAHYLRSRVGAEVIREFDIARLVEISDKITGP